MKYKKQKRKEYTFKGLIYFQASTKSTRYISKCRSNLKTLLHPLLSQVSLRKPGQSCSSWSCLLHESTSWLTAGETEQVGQTWGLPAAWLQGPINTGPTFASQCSFDTLSWFWSDPVNPVHRLDITPRPHAQLIKSNLRWSKWPGQDFRTIFAFLRALSLSIIKKKQFLLFLYSKTRLCPPSLCRVRLKIMSCCYCSLIEKPSYATAQTMSPETQLWVAVDWLAVAAFIRHVQIHPPTFPVPLPLTIIPLSHVSSHIIHIT